MYGSGKIESENKQPGIKRMQLLVDCVYDLDLNLSIYKCPYIQFVVAKS